ncbi:TetR/AcrR family transcriptional regulator, partial [Paenibacillus graminis]|uniref:TetR/AcrR family transcriptional regulator n=1 Tax=Paenibacillus graminis TaxID=189425 RepID=UPI0030C9B183
MSIYKEKKQKTKYLIQKSFLQVLEKKKFELTTIGDITKIAQINRGTFYLHYSDKFDLLNQMEEQLFSDIGNHIDELQSRYLPTRTFDIEQKQLA